jgi:nucleoid DNA-binding protein
LDTTAVERIGDWLAAGARDVWLYLPGVGWLTAKRYRIYDPTRLPGEVALLPEKVRPFFTPDPDLRRGVNGLPPESKSFADERARYLDAIHPDDEEAAVEETCTVERPPWVEAIADEVRVRLAGGEDAEVAGLGAFEIVDRPGRPGRDPDTGTPIQVPPRRIVRFVPSAELERRISGRR